MIETGIDVENPGSHTSAKQNDNTACRRCDDNPATTSQATLTLIPITFVTQPEDELPVTQPPTDPPVTVVQQAAIDLSTASRYHWKR